VVDNLNVGLRDNANVDRAADIDSRVQLKWWCSTGVWPLGAQVDLTEGRRLNPDSSWKTIQAPRRLALFLCGATPVPPKW
jgi:hypothetical protein